MNCGVLITDNTITNKCRPCSHIGKNPYIEQKENCLKCNTIIRKKTKTKMCRQCLYESYRKYKNPKETRQYLYRTWEQLKVRCYNKKRKGYKNYGGRGIKLYIEWHMFSSFQQYVEKNLGERPLGHSIDRINNDKDYEPGNIRWASRLVQNNNKRNSNREEV